jgi:hypothetical protein
LARDVGIALIVAFVIIISIEQRSRSELNRIIGRFLGKTHENLFQSILGVQFPKLMFDFVRDRLMKEPVFRMDTEVHYTIGSPSDLKRFGIATLMLDVTFSYRIKNLSDRRQTHPLRFFIEESGKGEGQEPPKLPLLYVDG